MAHGSLRRQIARDNLKRFAEEIILEADTVDSALENNPNLQGIEATNALDPEAWHVAAGHASKILRAVETNSRIQPRWVDAINLSLIHI